MDKTKEYELLGRVYQLPLSTLKGIIQEHGIVQSGEIEGLDHGSALELIVKWIQKELQSCDQTSIMSVDDSNFENRGHTFINLHENIITDSSTTYFRNHRETS